jgi:hypothetical protein
MAEPDATQVVAGSGLLYVAPLGTTLPTLDAHGENPVVWPAGWVAVGYTDDGIDMTYTPTVKDITVDEEMAPVAKLLTAEKLSISAKLAEATLANLNNAISASTYTNDPAGSAQLLKLGSGTLNTVLVGVEGPAPGTNLKRVIILYKAVAQAAVSMKMQRKDKVVIPVNFEALADSTKPAGQRLAEIVDLTSTAS